MDSKMDFKMDQIDMEKLTLKQLHTVVHKLFKIMTLDENIIKKFDFIDSIPYVKYNGSYEIVELQIKIDIVKRYYPYDIPNDKEECILIIDIIMLVFDCNMEHINKLYRELLKEDSVIEKEDDYSFIEKMFSAKSYYLEDYNDYNEIFPEGIELIFNTRVMGDLYSLQNYMKLKIYSREYKKLVEEGKMIMRLWNKMKFDSLDTYKLCVLVDKFDSYLEK